MSQFLGRAEITLNGEVYDSAPGATLNLGGIKNTAKIYGSKVGRVEELEASTLSMEIPLEAGKSLAAVRDLKDATVTPCGGAMPATAMRTGQPGGHLPGPLFCLEFNVPGTISARERRI